MLPGNRVNECILRGKCDKEQSQMAMNEHGLQRIRFSNVDLDGYSTMVNTHEPVEILGDNPGMPPRKGYWLEIPNFRNRGIHDLFGRTLRRIRILVRCVRSSRHCRGSNTWGVRFSAGHHSLRL